jgi:hypothetical protein
MFEKEYSVSKKKMYKEDFFRLINLVESFGDSVFSIDIYMRDKTKYGFDVKMKGSIENYIKNFNQIEKIILHSSSFRHDYGFYIALYNGSIESSFNISHEKEESFNYMCISIENYIKSLNKLTTLLSSFNLNPILSILTFLGLLVINFTIILIIYLSLLQVTDTFDTVTDVGFGVFIAISTIFSLVNTYIITNKSVGIRFELNINMERRKKIINVLVFIILPLCLTIIGNFLYDLFF